MAALLEFHGRLFSVHGAAPPGVYALGIGLYPERTSLDALWAEPHADVPVALGGYFAVVLGHVEPIPPGLFDGRPRWLGATGDEVESARTPVLGHALIFRAALQAMEHRVQKALRRTQNLHRRLSRLEAVQSALRPVDLRDAQGKLTALLEEMEELTGEDGDIIDLYERVERLEGVGPGKASVDPAAFRELAARVATMEAALRAPPKAKPQR